jgi:uncharacterized protein YcbK (DUF882 family)
MATALVAAWLAPNSTDSAVANGDTRTVVFTNQHTNESGSFTYMVNGVYDQAVLDKLNWFMRDWRLNEPTKMDPRLFDIIWEVYRESGSKEPIDVLSGYRSPQTNAMLRRRSRQVAEHSQHMEGRAIDAHFIDVDTARIRDIAMRMQEGGVGFYPSALTPWVHIDSGSVRYWPRMTRAALTRLFPDGKTVFIPSDGQPMPGYEQARAEIEARGGEVQTASGGGGLFAWLFGSRGGGADDAEESSSQAAVVIGGRGGGRSGGGAVQIVDAGPEAVAKAELGLPTGPAYAGPIEPASAPAPAPKTQVAAAPEQPQEGGGATAEPAETMPPPLAPLPPRRPSALELELASMASLPLPPIRPADLVTTTAPASPSVLPPVRPAELAAAAAPEMTGSVEPTPPIRPADLEVASAQPGAGVKTLPRFGSTELPKIITEGVAAPASKALALVEAPPQPSDDDEALLERAAELSAPLPPMPIPAVAPHPPAKAAEPARRRSAWAEGVSRLLSAISFGSF